MPWRNPPNRSAEYRTRAEEARAKAGVTDDKGASDALLQEADTWDRMAAWEDKNNPSQLLQGAGRIRGSRIRRSGRPLAFNGPVRSEGPH
jgi:hypothetical protein